MKKTLICIVSLLTACTAQDSLETTPDAQAASEVVEATPKLLELQNAHPEQ